MRLNSNLAQQNSMLNKNNSNNNVSFKAQRDSSDFKVNEKLEYASTVTGSLGLGSLLGAGIGAYIGLASRVRDNSANIMKNAGIGAAAGAALALVTLPFALNRKREDIYKKQLDFNIMGSIAKKADQGELNASEATAFLNSRALDKMSQNPQAANGNTLGLMAGSYFVGNSMGSSSNNKR